MLLALKIDIWAVNLARKPVLGHFSRQTSVYDGPTRLFGQPLGDFSSLGLAENEEAKATFMLRKTPLPFTHKLEIQATLMKSWPLMAKSFWLW
ncbi:MAG: hypothetical protein ACRD19_17745 [Terriglobia bacterium]